MPVPTYDKFIEPILRFLSSHPEGVPAREAHEAAATALDVSAEVVDRRRLAELMIDHEVGVSARSIKVPKLDSDYFDEGSA